jgi:hypothetical protein
MKVSVSFLVFIIAVTGLASCSKVDDDIVVPPTVTTIGVINAGPDTLNVFQRGTRLNSGSNLLPGGQYTNLQVSVGTSPYQFKKVGSPNALIDIPFTIEPLTRYTMFVAGQSADKVFLLRDTFPAPDTVVNTARIRFVNASPVDGTLDVSVGSTFNYKSVAFKSATPFIQVSSGKIALSIRQTGDTTKIAKGTLTLTDRSTYTLFTKGVLKGTGTNSFGARILVTPKN